MVRLEEVESEEEECLRVKRRKVAKESRNMVQLLDPFFRLVQDDLKASSRGCTCSLVLAV